MVKGPLKILTHPQVNNERMNPLNLIANSQVNEERVTPVECSSTGGGW